MAILINVNGVLREATPYVNINGVLRNTKSLVNVNGILREINVARKISEEDIESFILVYHLNKNPYHPDFSWLKYNPRVPARISLTGETPGVCDLNYAGVEFEYDRMNSKEEGIVMYTGHLYAILKDGTPIDVCCFNEEQLKGEKADGLQVDLNSMREVTPEEIKQMWYDNENPEVGINRNAEVIEQITKDEVKDIADGNLPDEGVPKTGNINFIELTTTELYNLYYFKIFPDESRTITEVLDEGEDELSNLKIQIQATLVYESNGYYMAGWNSLFSSIQFIDPTRYPEDEQRFHHYMNSYPILPVKDRLEEYNPLAQIGIARSTTNDGLNMNGSYGVLDQTIHWITVNGVKKPFVIEIYD